MSLKTQVIVNPESDKGRTRRRWSEIKEALKHFLKEFHYDFTDKPLQATEIARTAIKNGSELIVGVGGDGTLNEIANGFYEGRQVINPAVSLGIIPSGTGSDFVKSLRIAPGLKNALKVIAETPSTPIDIGRAFFQSSSGEPMERFFLNIAEFGIGGEVVKKVNERRLRRKASSYVRCLVSAMARYKNKRLRIRIDDEDYSEQIYFDGAVANGRVFGKGMKIAPQAKLDDGLFDTVLIQGMKFFELCRHGWKVFNARHLSHPKTALIRSRKIEVFPVDEEDVLLEIDGEQLGKLPARFEIIPRNILVKGQPPA